LQADHGDVHLRRPGIASVSASIAIVGNDSCRRRQRENVGGK
jgi:hypothetical protein